MKHTCDLNMTLRKLRMRIFTNHLKALICWLVGYSIVPNGYGQPKNRSSQMIRTFFAYQEICLFLFYLSLFMHIWQFIMNIIEYFIVNYCPSLLRLSIQLTHEIHPNSPPLQVTMYDTLDVRMYYLPIVHVRVFVCICVCHAMQ